MRESGLEKVLKGSLENSRNKDLFSKLSDCSENLFCWGKDLSRKCCKGIDKCRTQLVFLWDKTDDGSRVLFGEVKETMLKLII